ncbi:asparagine synthase (glutamine-hydrolysing) [Streptomyces sp. Amel2xB2]|uniref:asparagine synthase (glutamine-hydrolyzing) n=1 Tax=Streptomyces sp. Amel2xB2 TaxID=1305829 RepID=UPI000DB9373B|nr:asparagine synthase (glutamine-hydrolyzing) [Streptomyces sp. Amel2xB2]RAJ61647.1 asparagine synthase (glutamine-hydrolysing) [Streptomyces sp. Amel2xB2]
MCGITGWLDYARDMTAERSTIQAMARTLFHRGPDASGLWLGSDVALGHQRLSIIDPANGVQPMRADDGDPDSPVIVFNGEIYNYRELREQLALAGHRFTTRSDTEVLLRAYLEWGPECAGHLNGIFAYAIWDPRPRRLVLARDPIGVKPLFYHRTPDGLLFGSEPKAVLRHPWVAPVVDADGLRELLSHARNPGRAIFRDIPELPPGHVLTVEPGGHRLSAYWAPTANPHRGDLHSSVTDIRELLEDIVARQLISDVPTSLMLSGGIDSSALAALATGTVARQGAAPVHTYSMTFRGYTENFRPQKLRGTPDPPFAAQVAEHLGTVHTDVVATPGQLTDPLTKARTMQAQDMPTHHGDMDSSLYLAFRHLREESRVVTLSGEGADEIFGGYFWAHDPELTDAGTFPWVAFERRKAASGGLGLRLFDPALRKELDLYGYADQHYREALATAPVLDGESAAERRARQVGYLVLTRWLPTLLDREDRLSMANGVELRVPFCDHRLAQYLLDVPAHMQRTGGQEKSLLRSAVADLLPSAVVNRPKSAYPATQDPVYGRAVREQYLRLARDRDAPVAPLLDEQATRAVLDGDGADDDKAGAWVDRAGFEMVLQFDSWLREYDVRLDL